MTGLGNCQTTQLRNSYFGNFDNSAVPQFVVRYDIVWRAAVTEVITTNLRKARINGGNSQYMYFRYGGIGGFAGSQVQCSLVD